MLSDLEKGSLVDELEELSGYHRKTRRQLLQKQSADHGGALTRVGADHASPCAGGPSWRFGPEGVNLLETLWEASDHLCAKRLEAVLSALVPALERHGPTGIEAAFRQKLQQVSPATPATIDRLPAPARAPVVTGVRRRTAGRTFNGWKGVEPG